MPTLLRIGGGGKSGRYGRNCEEREQFGDFHWRGTFAERRRWLRNADIRKRPPAIAVAKIIPIAINAKNRGKTMRRRENKTQSTKMQIIGLWVGLAVEG
jgi:hypothetical protein